MLAGYLKMTVYWDNVPHRQTTSDSTNKPPLKFNPILGVVALCTMKILDDNPDIWPCMQFITFGPALTKLVKDLHVNFCLHGRCLFLLPVFFLRGFRLVELLA